jgi:hypothetical protein
MGTPEQAVQTGWRRDPLGHHAWRYWDGGWTTRVADEGGYGIDLQVPDGRGVDAEEEHAFDWRGTVSPLFMSSPVDYGRAMLVMFAAIVLGLGAGLPWLSGYIGGASFHRSGVSVGDGWYFTAGAVALAVAAVAAGRYRILRLVPLWLSLAISVLTVRELLNVYGLMTSMNSAPNVSVGIGIGVWAITGASLVALGASWRLGEARL